MLYYRHFNVSTTYCDTTEIESVFSGQKENEDAVRVRRRDSSLSHLLHCCGITLNMMPFFIILFFPPLSGDQQTADDMTWPWQ